METRLFDATAVERLAAMPAVIDAVAAAFGAHARGDVEMPAKTYIDLPQYNGDFRSMPCYLDAGEWDAAGVKWVNVHPDNPDRFDLPTVLALMIYSDPASARPLAVMDGTELTRRRTAAAAAVATEYLAVPDATSLGIVGAGAQSYTQVEAIASVRPIEELVVSDVNEDAVDTFIERLQDDFAVRPGSIADAGHCDVLCTLTPVRDPIVSPGDLGDHTHVNAIGADAAGKQELATELVAEATIVIDDYEQCTHSGEINVPWSEGALDDGDLHAELGEIVIGEAPGRESMNGITVFDSTGLAIQDVAGAHVVYENAADDTSGSAFDFYGRFD